ncbi:hypothetical protein [Sulfurimonas gotlandica]|nr:hypothetical protein [Sulfurimonas gotlandica]
MNLIKIVTITLILLSHLYAEQWYIYDYKSKVCASIDSPYVYRNMGYKVIQQDDIFIVSGNGVMAWITSNISTCQNKLKKMVEIHYQNKSK